MAKQVQKHLPFAYSLLRKDAKLCALFVGSSLNVISIVAGSAGETEGKGPAQSVAIQQVTPISVRLSTEPFAIRKWHTSLALAPCNGSERFVYGTSGSGFIRYWRPVYKSEDTIQLSEAFDRARDLLLDQLCE
jgi:hypothetical protein